MRTKVSYLLYFCKLFLEKITKKATHPVFFVKKSKFVLQFKKQYLSLRPEDGKCT